MLVAERRDLLVARLQADGKLIAKDLAAELGITEDNVRRDLRELAAAGLCQRVYGGALPVSPAIADYATRATVAPESKQRVGAAAAGLIRPRSTVLIDGGTTALALVHALPGDLQATVVTHSPTIAAALVEGHAGIDVVVLGGRLFKHSAVTCGAAAVEAAGQVRADVFFLGVTGIHAEAGLTTGDPRRGRHETRPLPPRRRHLGPGEQREDRRRLRVHGPGVRRGHRCHHRRAGHPPDPRSAPQRRCRDPGRTLSRTGGTTLADTTGSAGATDLVGHGHSVKQWALDPESAQRLWWVSLALLGRSADR